MKRAVALLALGACRGAAEDVVKGEEIQCIGRAAHKVIYTFQGEEVEDVSVQPAPAHDAECRHLGSGFGGDKHFCVGANADQTCMVAKKDDIPFPFGARCQGCFVSAESDLFYTLNMSKSHIESIGVGLRGTQLRSTLQIMDDKGKTPSREGSKTFGDKGIEFPLKVAGKVLATIRVSMPTEIYYKDLSREGWHTDAGINVNVDLGENSIEYTKGSGWKHHRDQARVTVTPVMEGDFDTQGNITVGLKSTLQIEVVDVMWFHVNVEPSSDLVLTSVGASASSDMIHACTSGGLHFEQGHEADLHWSRFNRTQHYGPHVDGAVDKPNLLHKCVDIHKKKPDSLLVV